MTSRVTLLASWKVQLVDCTTPGTQQNQQKALKSTRTYTVSWTNLAVCGARAGAEVEGLGGEAAMVEAHHVRPTRRPVLHVAQVRVLIELHMATTANKQEGLGELCCD